MDNKITYTNTMRIIRSNNIDNQYYLDQKGRQFDEEWYQANDSSFYSNFDILDNASDIIDYNDDKSDLDNHHEQLTAFCDKTGLHYESQEYQYLEAKDDNYYCYLENKARTKNKEL